MQVGQQLRWYKSQREMSPVQMSLFEAGGALGREPGHLRPQQRRKRLGEIARGNALQIKPR